MRDTSVGVQSSSSLVLISIVILRIRHAAKSYTVPRSWSQENGPSVVVATSFWPRFNRQEEINYLRDPPS